MIVGAEKRDARVRVGKHMYAERLDCAPRDVYTIHATDGFLLGYAEWYPRWRGYVFRPDSGLVMSWDCCLAMSRFLEGCNAAERGLR